MGARTYPWPPPMCANPSPDWRQPLWAKRLQHDVASMTRKVTSPPPGVEWEDFLQEVRLILMVRAASEKSKWDPARAAWPTWCCLVIKTFSENHRKKNRLRSAVRGEATPDEELEEVRGTLLPTLSEAAPLLLSADSEPKRPRRSLFPPRSNPLEGY